MLGLSNIWKGALAALGAVLLVFGIVKGYSYRDEIVAFVRQGHLVAADTLGKRADTLHAQASAVDSTIVAPARNDFGVYANSPEVRNNPVAHKVATKAGVLVAGLDKSNSITKAENATLRRQVTELEAAGPPPGPRAIPYADALYSLSSKGKPLPMIRAGLDYRVLPHVFARVEGSYQPPPTPAPGTVTEKPEFRLSVGGHFTFR